MFLGSNTRKKDGKRHRYWSVVESHRTADDRGLQRLVLYLGEFNDSQRRAWTRAIEVFAAGGEASRVAIFPLERALVASPAPVGCVSAGPRAVGTARFGWLLVTAATPEPACDASDGIGLFPVWV